MSEAGNEGAAPRLPEADRLRVFISYARADASDFAEYLVAGLKLAGFNAYLDRHDIAKAEDWEKRLDTLIRESDTVVFVISPASIRSPRCAWEVDRTIALGKRLVPVQWIEVAEAEVPLELKRRNYTFFKSGQPFQGPMAELAEALRTDLTWLRQRTRLEEDAVRWDSMSRDKDLLPRGHELAQALEWEKNRKPEAPEISALVKTYIHTAEEEAALRASEERKRLAAVAEEQRRRAQLIKGGALVVLALSGAAGWLWYEAARAREESAAKAREANVAREESEVKAAEANLARKQLEAATWQAGRPSRLVRNSSGRAALRSICEDAARVTSKIAGLKDERALAEEKKNFFRLYSGHMLFVELVQSSTGAGAIERAMQNFRTHMEAGHTKDTGLLEAAGAVRAECEAFLATLGRDDP